MPPISFNSIPNTQRVPFAYVEFDSSKAQQGPSVKKFKMLVMGQKTSAGLATVNNYDLVTSIEQAKQLYGRGSHLATMIETIFNNQKVVELWAVSVADDGSAVAAAGTITFTGTPTESGTYAFYVGGKRYSITITTASTPTSMAVALVAAITADADAVVTAANSSGVVTVTAKNGGLLGNKIDLRANYYAGEKTPAGVTAAIVAMASGAANPSISTAITNMPETQYDVVCFPWLDATNLAAINAVMTARNDPALQLDGVVMTAQNDTVGNLATLGNTYNTQFLSIQGGLAPTLPWVWAAAYASQVALAAQTDPARPFQTLPMTGVYAPAESDKFSNTEQNTLLYAGISTHTVSAGGIVRISRGITTYKTNGFGGADTSYLDLTSVFTLSYLRYDFRNKFLTKYPRHKLANDGTRFGPGQAILTPSGAKAEAINIFKDWEEIGLVENFDQFKQDLVVERNASDPTRLDFILPPDLVNGLLIAAAQIQFRL